MIQKLGGRKVFFALLAILVGAGAVVLLGDVPPNFKSLIEWVLGTFVAGNVAAGAAAAVATAVGSKSDTAQVDMQAIDAAIAKLEEQNAVTQQGVGTVIETLNAALRRPQQ